MLVVIYTKVRSLRIFKKSHFDEEINATYLSVVTDEEVVDVWEFLFLSSIRNILNSASKLLPPLFRAK